MIELEYYKKIIKDNTIKKHYKNEELIYYNYYIQILTFSLYFLRS